ncbi:MAG: hypothetical protein ACEY3F_01910 [Wolbachia sp.]
MFTDNRHTAAVSHPLTNSGMTVIRLAVIPVLDTKLYEHCN